MTAQYQLVMHSGPTPGKVFPLEGDVITIGREADNGIVINDAEVSRKHTQLIFQGGKIIVTDLGSTNGTFINSKRLTEQHILQPGEIVSLGEQINLLFESVVQVDPNATMLSSGHAPIFAPPPVATPSPTPRPVSQPISRPAYAGQVPAGPGPMSPTPAKSNSSRIAIIIAIVVLLCIVCSCAGLLYYIDSQNQWCNYLPFLFGGSCGG
jgi:hypothetical protein